MLYIINIHWTRRIPQEGRPDQGRSTYAEYAKSLTAAKRKASAKFRLHYGMHLAIESAEEFEDPAGIFKPQPAAAPSIPVRDCGSGHRFGVCPKCRQPHGHIIMERGLQSATH